MGLQIGQRFDVVSVQCKHPGNDVIPIGWQSVLIPDKVYINQPQIFSKYNLAGFTFTMFEGDYKKVGTLVITKVK
jgi:hypothetical protein